MATRVAAVTGASAGIGAAYSERLAADGWDLIVTGRRTERLEALRGRLEDAHGVTVEAVAMDHADDDANAEFGRRLASEAGLELLVNNAGVAHYMPFSELPFDSARELVRVNVETVVRLSNAVVGPMVSRGRGQIVNVASMLAFSGAMGAPLPDRAVYAATKSFVVTFSLLLAAELDNSGVGVQVLCPGVVRTEFHSRQDMELSSGVPSMDADAVVDASLRCLEQRVVVCIPGLADPAPLQLALDAQADLFRTARSATLPHAKE